ncbi:MAG: YXWGXW repeat-containing protein [Gammaproteobacteria bacterium]
MKRFAMLLMGALLFAGSMLALPATASAQVSIGISVRVGPPPLPVYPQPFAPGPGFIWAPGYWGYGPYGYYWVPGTWVLAPRVGFLWTPGYWGWRGGFYWWHPGYWGPRVGFYGGIHYGYGYTGVGYVGGYWRGNAFYYNRAVSHVNVTYIHNTYNQTVINNTTRVNRVSYNGGEGGIDARPTAEQEAFAREPHVALTKAQIHQERLAMNNPAQRFSTNHGRPEIAATAKPGKFKGPGVVRMNRTKDTYAYHPAKRDRAVYQNERHAGKSGSGRPDHPNQERHEYGQPHAHEQKHNHEHEHHRPGGPPPQEIIP